MTSLRADRSVDSDGEHLFTRGALQEIDQMSLMRPVVKGARRVPRVRDLVPASSAFREWQGGVPGPVFVEVPADPLYDEATVREWQGMKSKGRSFSDRAMSWCLGRHLGRVFDGAGDAAAGTKITIAPEAPRADERSGAAAKLQKAEGRCSSSEARQRSVLVDVIPGASDFRKGSISTQARGSASPLPWNEPGALPIQQRDTPDGANHHRAIPAASA